MHIINRSHRHLVRALVAAVPAVSLLGGLVAAPASGATRALRLVSFTGHGWGAGLGMGQWGDFGDAVAFHETAPQILAHFYGGTTLNSLSTLGRAADPTVGVLILENLNLKTNVGYDPVITSTSGFVLTSAGVSAPAGNSGSSTTSTTSTSSPSSTTLASTTSTSLTASSATSSTSTTIAATTSTAPTAATSGTSGSSGSSGSSGPGSLRVPAGSAVDLRIQPNGTFSAYLGTSCSGALAATTPSATGLANPIANAPSSSPTAPRSQLLTLCRHDGVDEVLRGSVEAYDRSGYARTINLLPLDSYLDGVVPAEESASWGSDGGTTGAPQGEAWGFQALEAQAVAARSYTLAYAASGGWNGYADICDTTDCEAYVGANYEYAISDLAVSDTSGQVLTSATSQIVSARFSASTGGYTAPGTFPAVPDLGDTCVVPGNPLECNPNHTWHTTVTATAIARHYPRVGKLLSIRVAARNHDGAFGGRAVVVSLVGSRATLRVGAGAFTTALGLRSDWFAVSHVVRGEAVPATTTTTTVPSATTTSSTSTTLAGATTTTTSSATTTTVASATTTTG